MRTSNKYIRPYKVEIYGLQDNFIGTLQSYNDSSIGRVQEPILEISTDGTQKFTCSIPKYYIDKTTNQKLPNPRWEDTENGILAENTRVLKVFVKYPNETKVYPLIIDNLTTKRDDHFAVYREITANGLAFAELGKLGYKLELTHTTLEADYKENSKTIATINYWLDKVFPNERDANGKVIKWLTPWCYEIRMEWESLTGEILASDKIYDSPCVSSWGLTDDGKMLSPQGVSDYIEKARYIDCQYSNKYNITQTIAETYEVFCTYEYKCAENGTFIRNYTDENGNYWTGRKVVFYNRAIDMENPLVVNYQKNLNTVSRTVDSSEIYTKMYVKPIESTVVPSGLISIADTSLNPILDDFILNFDYLHSIGNITDEQAQFIDDYKVELHKINTSLKALGEKIADYTVLKNEEESKVSSYEKELKAAQETLKKYEVLRSNGDMGSVTISATEGIPIGIYFYEKNDLYTAALTQEGINASTIQGYKSQTINSNNLIFDKVYDYDTNIDINSTQNQAKVYVTYNEEGYPNSLITSLYNPNLAKTRSVWLTMVYTPGNYYNDICKTYSNLIANYTSKRDAAKSMLEKYEVLYDEFEKKETDLLTSKDLLNQKLENRLGPALREGYWAPTSYEDPGESREENLKITNGLQETKPASMFFDTELLETEEKGWYQEGIEEEAAGIKHYYDYVNISSVYKAWSAATVDLDDLTIHLLQTRTYPFPNTFNDSSKTYYAYLYYNNIPYYFKLQGKANTANYELKLSEEISGLVLKLVTISSKKEETVLWLSERDTDKALMTAFNNAGLTAGTYLYKDAGFVFSYLKSGSTFIPIIIFNDKEIYKSALYNTYLTGLAYSFTNSDNMGSLPKKIALTSKSVLGYPRIKIHNTGVMYESDALEIIPYLPSNKDGAYSDGVFSPLTKYEDYIITTNKGEPVFTLKPTGAQTLEKILDWPYHIKYKISRANELLYMDAIDVAYDSSRPRYSYELSVANLPQNVNNIRLGQLVQINDYSVGLRCETGYISTIKFNLDSPQDDDLTIQDYTTKFEDLFASITATNEAMKQNQNLYNTVAGSFAPNGAISGSVLQTALYNNELAFNYSHTRVEISPTEGIILTNLTPYDNGVYGQVVLKGGGVFLSSSLDAQGNRIWSEAITPTGINASLLTAGAIDTSLIRIYSGDNLSFQWNGDGLFAYKRDEEGRPTMDAYVKYSDQGLQFIMEEPNNENNCSVHLGWEGLKLAAQSGALTLTAQNGLQIFYPKENGTSQAALQVGRWSKNNVGAGANTINYYGMRLFDTNGNETFTVDNYGNLMITGTMQSKRFASGILGYGWQIRNDGTAEFQDVHVRGTISASVFEYKETTAVGGELYVGPTLIVGYNRAKEAKFTYANNQLTLEADLGFTGSGNTELCGRTWAINDVLGINCCLTNDAGKKYEIKNLRMRLTTINNTVGKPDKLVSSTLWDTSLNVFYDENSNPIQLKDIDWRGLKASGPINCIFIGSESGAVHNRKGILLTAMADNSPYMDIYDDARSKIAGTPKVRIGNLDGLGQLSWDGNTMKPEGYGLYSDNVYLTGAIYATSGKIGSLTINEVENGVNSIKIRLESSSGLAFKEGISTTTILQSTITTSKGTQITSAAAFADKGITNVTLTYQLNNGSGWTTLAGGIWSGGQFTKTGIVMNSSTKYRIYLKYTSNNIENTVYSNELSFTSSGTTITNTTTEYAVSSSGTTPPSNGWSTSIKATTVGQFLWTRVTITYSDGESTVSYSVSAHGATGPQGIQGIDGDSAVNYNIITNVNTIARDVQPPLSVNSLIIGAKKVIGKNETIITNLSSEGLTITCQNMTTNSNGEISLTAINSSIISNQTNQTILTLNHATYGYQKSVKKQSANNGTTSNHDTTNAGAYANITGIKITLKLQGAIVHTVTIPFTIGDNLSAMGMIQNGKVVVDGGLLAANTVAAYSIVAGSITTRELEVGTITSGFNNEHAGKMQFTETGLAMTGGTIAMDAKSSLNLTGGSINLNGGVFTIGSGNFNIDAQGNVTIKGNITATEGKIGGWTIETNSLYAGSGASRVVLSTGNPTYAIWAGNETAANAPFRVGKNGAFVATSADITGKITSSSGSIGGWTLATGYMYSGSDTSSVYLSTTDSTYRIWAGSATASSAPFRVGKNGSLYASNAEITGKITADDGQIGGWTIGTNSLYAGSGTNRVALSTGNPTYAMWAGNETAANAPFRVTKDGKVYLTRVMALANEGDTTPTEVNLSNVSFWKLNRAVKTLEVKNDTLTIGLYNGTTVNFKKAAQNFQSVFLDGSGGSTAEGGIYSGGSVEIRGYKTDGTYELIERVSGTINMPAAKDITRDSRVVLNISTQETSRTDWSLPLSSAYDAGEDSVSISSLSTAYMGYPGNIDVTVNLSNGKRSTITTTDSGIFNTGLKAASPTATITYDSSTHKYKIEPYTQYMGGAVTTGTVKYTGTEAYDAGSGTGYNTGYAAGKEAYKPTIINRTGYDTDAKTVTVRALNSHQDLLTGVAIDASEIYEAGRAAGRAEMGIIRNGNTVTVGVSDTKTMRAYLFDTHRVVTGPSYNFTPGTVFTSLAGTYYYGDNVSLGGSAAVRWE